MASNSTKPARRGFDPITFVIGLGALFVAAVGLGDDTGWVAGFDPRWLLAAGAVLVGVLLLIGTLRRPSNRHGQSEDTNSAG